MQIKKYSKNKKCSCGKSIQNTSTNCNTCKQTGKRNHAFGKPQSKEHIEKRILLNNKHGMWNGGRYLSRGYVYVMVKGHPYSTNGGYMREHRLVMEKYLGRYLTKKEIVHHINGIKVDNRIENLLLFKNQSEHKKFHEQMRDFLLTKNLMEEYIKYYNLKLDN